MIIPLTSVQSAGVAIRTMRKRARIRIDDFALTASVSKQFMTDLENGKDTVQMGMVLSLLQRMGVRVSLELPDEVANVFHAEFDKVTRRRSLKSASRSKPAQVSSKFPSALDSDIPTMSEPTHTELPDVWDSFFLGPPGVSEDYLPERATQNQPERDAL